MVSYMCKKNLYSHSYVCSATSTAAPFSICIFIWSVRIVLCLAIRFRWSLDLNPSFLAGYSRVKLLIYNYKRHKQQKITIQQESLSLMQIYNDLLKMINRFYRVAKKNLVRHTQWQNSRPASGSVKPETSSPVFVCTRIFYVGSFLVHHPCFDPAITTVETANAHVFSVNRTQQLRVYILGRLLGKTRHVKVVVLL